MTRRRIMEKKKDRGESTKASSQWRKIAQAWACGEAQPQKKGKGCQCLIRKTDGGLSSNRSDRDRLLLNFSSLRLLSILGHLPQRGWEIKTSPLSSLPDVSSFRERPSSNPKRAGSSTWWKETAVAEGKLHHHKGRLDGIFSSFSS